MRIKEYQIRNGNDKWTWTVNNIGDEGARMISETLKINSTLTELNLYCDVKYYKIEKNKEIGIKEYQ